MTELTQALGWPPTYVVKKHKLARRVKFKISLSGLEIVTPPRFNLKHIPTLLEKHRAWITKHLTQWHAKQSDLCLENLPSTIFLPMLNAVWQIQYEQVDSKVIFTSENTHQKLLLLKGNLDNNSLCRKALHRWLMRQAKHALPERIATLSIEKDLPYRNVKIKKMKTRWGSCSKEGDIHLNVKLILLPIALVDHILLHELAHTQHFDHSKDFWALLTTLDPETKQHAKLTRNDHSLLPGWAIKED